MLDKSLPIIGTDIAAYRQRHDLVLHALATAADTCGITVLDPVPYLCPAGFCSGNHAQNPLYYDDDHLSVFGNAQIKPLLEKAFQNTAR